MSFWVKSKTVTYLFALWKLANPGPVVRLLDLNYVIVANDNTHGLSMPEVSRMHGEKSVFAWVFFRMIDIEWGEVDCC